MPFISFIWRLVMRCKPDIAIACILISQEPGRIAEPVLEREIEIIFMILCMKYINHLFGIASQQIRKYSKGFGSVVEFSILYRIIIHIVLMKTCIEPGFKNRVK